MTTPTTPPPAPYRAPDLAAECASLRAEVERLRARVPMRYAVAWNEGNVWLAFAAVIAWACDALGFVCFGACAVVLRGAAVCAVASLLWALAFVRRVPAEGARS